MKARRATSTDSAGRWGSVTPRATWSALLAIVAVTAGCGEILGFDDKVGRGENGPDSGPASTTVRVKGTFVSGGGVAHGSSVVVRGGFSWTPSRPITNGTTTVAGHFE